MKLEPAEAITAEHVDEAKERLIVCDRTVFTEARTPSGRPVTVLRP